MPDTLELAQRLVEYDDELAADVLALVCEQLGGPAADGVTDLDKMRTFLAQADVARSSRLSRLSDVAEAPSTTDEWKSEFHHSERMRRFRLAPAEALR